MTRFAEPPPPAIHLLRGAAGTRAWSRYQQTVPGWTLCGVRCTEDKGRMPTRAVENPNQVTCEFCLQLMLPTQPRGPAEGGQ